MSVASRDPRWISLARAARILGLSSDSAKRGLVARVRRIILHGPVSIHRRGGRPLVVMREFLDRMAARADMTGRLRDRFGNL